MLVTAFIADTPARNYAMDFPGHCSRSAKCLDEGRTEDHVRIFEDDNAELRIPQNFRERLPPEFENSSSFLETIGLELPYEAPLDPMHLMDSGNGAKHIKRIFDSWGKGIEGQTLTELISAEYIALTEWVPRDFGRKPRSFTLLKDFKASEYRMILLYICPVLFSNYLAPNELLFFLKLHCGYRILSDPLYCISKNGLAKELFISYLDDLLNNYGPKALHYNSHNLKHLPDDVRRYGVLQNFSCVDMEGFLHDIKLKVTKKSQVLSQILNRSSELSKSGKVLKSKILTSNFELV